jgi:NhaP-type Na+/H+ or K+/H+ antiporter
MAALSCIPCVSEAVVIALVSQWTFPQMNFPWALMLGFVIADVSPAVTTPLLLDFQDRGYGVEKGIPSILLAGGSVNSVLAIVLYSVMWEFSWGDDVQGFAIVELVLVKLVVQICIVGVLAGWVEGRILSRAWNICESDVQRFCLVTFVAMCNLFGFAKVGMGGGGCLACLTFGAAFQHSVQENGFADTKRVQEMIAEVWTKLGSVLLFTLLGASIDQSKLDPVLVACAALTILVGLAARSCATFASTACLRDWSAKERAFAVVSWCPKATVQAALASRALDYVQANVAEGVDRFVNDPNYVETMTERSEVILTTAVLSIIMTAPVFAVLMSIVGERWLTKTQVDSDIMQETP